MKTTILLSGLALALGMSSASAVPYASGVSKTGNTVTFVLNQNAANVEVLRDGGSAVNPGTTAGSHTFDMTGFTTYEIRVTGNDMPAWTQYVPDQVSTAFYVPFGVSINKIPNSPNFGKVYVSEALGGTTGGRTTSDGIYALGSDGTDAGWFSGGLTWSGGSNPYKSTIGPDGHLYVADLSNDLAYEFNDDMSVATQLIDASNKTDGQYVRSIWVEGTKAAGNRKIYLVDSNGDSTRKGLIRYDLDANDTAIGLGTGTQIVGPAYYKTSYYPFDVAGDSSGNWYINAYRGILNQMPAITKFNGSGTLPLDDDFLWETDPAVYYYAFCVDVNETSKLVAYGSGLVGTGTVFFFSTDTGAFLESFDAGDVVRELAFDAAGNLVTVDNSLERARFWSPGGYTLAITSFDGVQNSFQMLKPATEVAVAASQGTISETGPAAAFTISRSGATASSLTIYYTLSGTATNGVDYSTLSGTATIPANATSVDVTVAPVDDTIAELTETIILNLSANSNYSVAIPPSSTISILDNETPQISFTSAADKKLLESYAPSKVTHQLVRRGLLASPLTVNISFSGSATRGADFAAPETVSFGANISTANLVLTSVNDQAYEGNETAIANIASGAGYDIGSPGSISATVIDDEPPPGTVLFSDDFETDSSSLWSINFADDFDGFVDFAWDYGSVGIPPAPGTTDGSTRGMRMRVGNTYLQIDGLSASPLGRSFTGDYRMKFDMWINYNGPIPDGGPGSTQNFDAGVGTSGDQVEWLNNPNSDGVWFTATGDGADGNAGGDYTAMIGPNIQNDDTGFYAAGTDVPNSGIRNGSHPFYALWGGQAAPAAQLALYPNQTGVANRGNAGMAWHTVVITKISDAVTWAIDGITVATVTNTTLPFGDNVFVGYQDLFASGSLSDVPDMSFGLVDNFKVQSLVAPAQPVITGIQLINNNTQAKIIFTAGAGDQPAAFGLVSASSLTGTFNPAPANITSPVAGRFEAVTSVGVGSQFYRIRRN